MSDYISYGQDEGAIDTPEGIKRLLKEENIVYRSGIFGIGLNKSSESIYTEVTIYDEAGSKILARLSKLIYIDRTSPAIDSFYTSSRCEVRRRRET